MEKKGKGRKRKWKRQKKVNDNGECDDDGGSGAYLVNGMGEEGIA
jgi:hypothetical protein